MKRFVIACALIILAFSACIGAFAETSGVMKFHATISGLLNRNGLLIVEFPQGISKSEAEIAGAVFLEEPMNISSSVEKKITSESWNLDNESVCIFLDGIAMAGATFQFSNDQLADITLNIPTAESAQTIYDALATEFGESQEIPNVFGDSNFTIHYWEYDAAGMYGRVALGRQFDQDGQLINSTVSFCLLSAELYPDLYAKVQSAGN